MTRDRPPSTLGDPSRCEAPRLLLVDDHGDLRAGMAKYLAWHGFAVTEADDGRSALDALATGPPFRYLLTDLSLPDLDGREITREARLASPSTWNALITGWDVQLDDVRPWGVDQVFHKPVNLADLCKRLAEEPTPIANAR